MPWDKKQNQEGCPPNKPWAVVDEEGEVEGCYATEDEADAAIAANAGTDEESATSTGVFTTHLDNIFGAIASHSTGVDTTSAWDGGAAEKKMNNTEANNKKMYAWRDPDGDPDARASYKFPHHNVGDDGTPGQANAKGCQAGIAAINGGRGGTSIPAGDRKGVYNHLAKHLKDADIEPPEFKASLDGAELAVTETEPGTPVVDGESGSREFEIPVMVIEGAWTGDRRWIDPGVLTWRDLPLPTMAITKTTMGHDDAELSGKLTEIIRKDATESGLIDPRTSEPYAEGTTYLAADGLFDSSEWATEIRRLVKEEFLRGVSVDLSDVTSDIVFVDQDGNEVDDVDFFDWLFGPMDEGDDDVMDLEPAEKIRAGRVMGVTICPFPAFEGAYVAIPDGLVAGAFVTTPEYIEAGPDERWPSIVNLDTPFKRPLGLVASSAPIRPPFKWFEDPHFGERVPSVNIDADGHIYGYIATWDECHTAFNGQCIIAPHSLTDYAYYRLGGVLCDDETLVSTGVISMGTGHAELWMDAVQAKAHYDNTGTAMADVVCGEDTIGIWYTGSVIPDADEIAIRRLRGSVLSGDWRTRGGHLEMVAALAVNTPGYPVKRPMVRVASGMPQAMVAAGMVTDRTVKKSTATSRSHRVVDDAYKDKVVRDALRNRVHG